ncbi:hypothetical protein DFJ73DRAFT_798173 [Zopfochytrium polystomum]|nr:hypothetical protein DFJ73DRAFT_798173 [Zopfochytrium polystomum]
MTNCPPPAPFISFEGEDFPAVESFDTMGLHGSLVQGLTAFGLLQRANPSAIPAATTRNRKVVITAPSSKTTTIAISALQKIRPDLKQVQAIVLVPTHERDQAFKLVLDTIGKKSRVPCRVCAGFLRQDVLIAAAATGTHLVVGTPVSVLTQIQSGRVPTAAVAMLALDDADLPALRGLANPVHEIFLRLPRRTTVLLAASALPTDPQLLAAGTAHNPVHVHAADGKLSLDRAKQFYIPIDRPETDSAPPPSPLARAAAVRDYRTVELRYLVVYEGASERSPLLDVIDVVRVHLIVHYDFPRDPMSYLWRVGRGGDGVSGRKASAVSFVVGEEDMRSLREVERLYGTRIDEAPANLGDFI